MPEHVSGHSMVGEDHSFSTWNIFHLVKPAMAGKVLASDEIGGEVHPVNGMSYWNET